MDDLSRRGFVAATTGLLWVSACSLPDSASAESGDLDLVTPDANLRAMIRMQASLREEDVPWWFNGTIYGVVGDQSPRALFRFEGMEIYWVRHLDDGTYELIGNTVTFFRDIDTGQMIDEFRNPYTGQVNGVGAAVQGGGPGRGFNLSVNGVRPSSMIDQIPDKPLIKWWSTAAGQVWLNNETVYPPGMPDPHGQSQSMFTPRAAFHDASELRLPAAFSSTVFMGWLKWMDMGDRPGHLVWHAAGVKLGSIGELPSEFRERADREYPERMSAAPVEA